MPATNAGFARRVLAGEPGPQRDMVLLNAAAGLVAAGVCADLEAGLGRAAAAIDEGRADAALERLVAVSCEAAHRGVSGGPSLVGCQRVATTAPGLPRLHPGCHD